MKKYLPIIAIGLLVILAASFLVINKQKKPGDQTANQLPETEIPEAPVNQRPFVSLIPRSDAHQLTLKVINLQNIKTVEYELVYLVNDLQRGVIGSVETNGNSSVEKDMLLGSCSKNVCKYDEGVTEGSLTLRFRGQNGVSKYESAFHLQKLPEAKNELTLDNNNFVFDGTLKKGVYYLTMNTVGVPKDPDQEIVSDPYGIFSSDGNTVKGIPKIKSPDSGVNKLLGWSDQKSSWSEVTDTSDGLTVFVLVK